MKIEYKMIQHERLEDAPFVGALISACDCKFHCYNCFNQHVKNLPTLIKEADEIITEVKANIFNTGIIFAGLEWSLQKEEVIEMARLAKANGLKTILYTGFTFENTLIKEILQTGYFDYVKCGQYCEELKTANHIEYGVVLASSNQHIYKKGKDY